MQLDKEEKIILESLTDLNMQRAIINSSRLLFVSQIQWVDSRLLLMAAASTSAELKK